ncbi:signal peptidase II [Haliangium ochraceum]|uniref:Lipoprotein signal peptidase n=1 Tax=Haliangium ochraceum (strain DSM 14365 / JCM 11303 / SMP-2) TaxID=502025 RepID=D0LNT1_HALO1|nr:signal peptidase II [Haliangium ochraceum]ACY16986.1 lipoprotein signal peptidase [Haliangium ochraceum DSM 14365]
MPRRWNLFLIVSLVSLVADQITKIWARSALPTVTGPNGRLYGVAQPVVENFFDWRLSFNTGSAFSLFSGERVFLTVVGLLAVGIVFYMVYRARNDQTKLALGLGLVAGGAIGNLVDRILFGKVTDFVVWKYYETEWPTFNIADVALVIGVGLLFLDMWSEMKLEAQENEKAKKLEAAKGR